MLVDFHCHTHHSDGQLSAFELLEMAENKGIKCLAVTDHDNCDALSELRGINTSIKIISGIEFSTSWNKIGVHIVGLNFDEHSLQIQQIIAEQSKSREQRAQIISNKMRKFGLIDGYEKLKHFKNCKQIGRPDFAKLMIQEGLARDWKHAFNDYLGAGKAGDVKNKWLNPHEIIESINTAGGIAILAHPLYYKLTNSKLNRLLSDFVKMGGEGIEVVNGYQNSDKTEYMKNLQQKYQLKASIGSDFHSPNAFKTLGCDTSIVDGLAAVWDDF